MGILAQREKPLQKHQSRWSVPSLSLFPCWDFQILGFLPLPSLESNGSLEVLELSRAGASGGAGGAALHAALLPQGMAGLPGCAPRQGGLWCSLAVLALEICLRRAGFKAWQGSVWKLCWERFLDGLKWISLGFFLFYESTVGFLLSLFLKTGVVEWLWCACWSPSLCFSMEL